MCVNPFLNAKRRAQPPSFRFGAGASSALLRGNARSFGVRATKIKASASRSIHSSSARDAVSSSSARAESPPRLDARRAARPLPAGLKSVPSRSGQGRNSSPGQWRICFTHHFASLNGAFFYSPGQFKANGGAPVIHIPPFMAARTDRLIGMALERAAIWEGRSSQLRALPQSLGICLESPAPQGSAQLFRKRNRELDVERIFMSRKFAMTVISCDCFLHAGNAQAVKAVRGAAFL